VRYICNICGDVVQEHDGTIHYDKCSNGFEIVAVCHQCLDKYFEKRKIDTNVKEDENERMKMDWKW
jgi:ribosome-binding protein aMBF1 (putative translation factor)